MLNAAASPKSKRKLALLATLALSAAMLVPAVAATPALAHNEVQCEVNSAELKWGLKESFRSYISGRIANGGWETSNGASYETPDFIWNSASGWVAEAGDGGEIAFSGAINFTGHDGLLATTISNPKLKIEHGAGIILLDINSLSMDDAMAGATENAVDLKGVEFATFELPSHTAAVDGEVTISAEQLPGVLSEEGAAAFGSYEAGDALDPITFTATANCDAPEPSPSPSASESAEPVASESPAASDDAATEPSFWWGIAAGVVAALAVAGVVLALMVRKAKRQKAAAGEATEPEAEQSSDDETSGGSSE